MMSFVPIVSLDLGVAVAHITTFLGLLPSSDSIQLVFFIYFFCTETFSHTARRRVQHDIVHSRLPSVVTHSSDMSISDPCDVDTFYQK